LFYHLLYVVFGLVTHTKFIQFQIFMKIYSKNLKCMIEYSNIFGYTIFAKRISEYIRKYKIYKLNTRIYLFSQKTIFIFEYWVFGEQYLNIRIYSNIRPSLTPSLNPRISCACVVYLFVLMEMVEICGKASWGLLMCRHAFME
jgi:hypothetical protein